MKYYFERRKYFQQFNPQQPRDGLRIVKVIISNRFISKKYIKTLECVIKSYNLPHIRIKVDGSERFHRNIYRVLRHLINNRFSISKSLCV